MPSARLRLAGSAAVVVLVAVAVGACTGVEQLAPPTPAGTAGTATAGDTRPLLLSGGVPSTVALGGGSEAVRTSTNLPVPGPAMTTIAEASACTTRTDLGGRAPVRPEQLWPGASEIGFTSAQVQARAGSVTPSGRCRAALPATPDCDLTFPWGAVSDEDLVVATGAQRLLTGRSYARLAAASDAVKGSASLIYSVLDFGSPGSRVDTAFSWYERSVERCGIGARGSSGGVPGLVGSGHRPTLLSTVPGRFLISVSGARLVVLVFEGGAWSDTSRADATRRALPLLLAS